MSRPERIKIDPDVQICFNDAEIVTGKMDMKTGGRKNMKGGRRMVYSRIKFQVLPFSYDLEFTERIISEREANGRMLVSGLLCC